MTCESVYQSVRCCEFSELYDDAVPQLDVAALADRHASHRQQNHAAARRNTASDAAKYRRDSLMRDIVERATCERATCHVRTCDVRTCDVRTCGRADDSEPVEGRVVVAGGGSHRGLAQSHAVVAIREDHDRGAGRQVHQDEILVVAVVPPVPGELRPAACSSPQPRPHPRTLLILVLGENIWRRTEGERGTAPLSGFYYPADECGSNPPSSSTDCPPRWEA